MFDTKVDALFRRASRRPTTASTTRGTTSTRGLKKVDLRPPDAGPRGGRPAGVDPDRGVRDPARDPEVAPAGVRSPGGPRKENEDPPAGGRQAAARALRLGPRGPGRGVPADGSPENRVSNDAAGEGHRGPPRPRCEGIPRRLPRGLPAGDGRPRGEARGGGGRGGEGLLKKEGGRGPLPVGREDGMAGGDAPRAASGGPPAARSPPPPPRGRRPL